MSPSIPDARKAAVVETVQRFLIEQDLPELSDATIWERGHVVLLGRRGGGQILIRPCPLCEGAHWGDVVPDAIQAKHPGTDLRAWWSGIAPLSEPATLDLQTLRLRCPSPLCDAYGGLDAQEWAPRAGAPYLAPRPVVPIARDLGRLSEARQDAPDGGPGPLRDALREGLRDVLVSPSRMVVMSIPMGAGKTRTLTEVVATLACDARRTPGTKTEVMPAYLCARHDLVEEVERRYNERSSETARLVKGHARDGMDETCFLHGLDLRRVEEAQRSDRRGRRLRESERRKLVVGAHNIGMASPQPSADAVQLQAPPGRPYAGPAPLARPVVFDENPSLLREVRVPVSGIRRILQPFDDPNVEAWAYSRRMVVMDLDGRLLTPLLRKRKQADEAAEAAGEPPPKPWMLPIHSLRERLMETPGLSEAARVSCPALHRPGTMDESTYLSTHRPFDADEVVAEDHIDLSNIGRWLILEEEYREHLQQVPRYPLGLRAQGLIPGRDLPLVETDTVLRALYAPDQAKEALHVTLDLGPRGQAAFVLTRRLGPLLPSGRPTLVLDGTAHLQVEAYKAALAPATVEVRNLSVTPDHPAAIRRLHLVVGRGVLQRKQTFHVGSGAVKTDLVVPKLVRLIRRVSEGCRTDVVPATGSPARVLWIVAQGLVEPLQACAELALTDDPVSDTWAAWTRVVDEMRQAQRHGHIGQWSLAHQGAVRGSNQWEDHEVCVTMPYCPNLGSVWMRAAMLGIHPDQLQYGMEQDEIAQELARVRPLSATPDAPRLLVAVGTEAPDGWAAAGFEARPLGVGTLRALAAADADVVFRALVASFGATSAGFPAWATQDVLGFLALCTRRGIAGETAGALAIACRVLTESGRVLKTLREDLGRVARQEGWQKVPGPPMGGADLKGRPPAWFEAAPGAAAAIW